MWEWGDVIEPVWYIGVEDGCDGIGLAYVSAVLVSNAYIGAKAARPSHWAGLACRLP